MSIDKGSSYNDDENPDIEYGKLLYKSIPWNASGEGILTPKLVLWWMLMLTKNDVSVQNRYAPLDSWKITVATGISRKEPPPSAHINQFEPSKDQQTTPDYPLNIHTASTIDKNKELGKKRR